MKIIRLPQPLHEEIIQSLKKDGTVEIRHFGTVYLTPYVKKLYSFTREGVRKKTCTKVNFRPARTFKKYLL